MNAIANAIPNGAADHMQMPATPSKLGSVPEGGVAKYQKNGRDNPAVSVSCVASQACEMNFTFM
jgi:hypothetical protein